MECLHEGHRQRIREKLFSHQGSLEEHEILEILLFDAIPRKDTNPIAHALLDSFGSLKNIFSASPQLLCTVSGIGKSTAERICLMGLLLDKIQESQTQEVRLYNFSEVNDFVRKRFSGNRREKLEIYMLDERNILLCIKTLTDIQSDLVAMDSKTFSFILSEVKPKKIILAHNHPSKMAVPSEKDDASLKEFVKICKMHGVNVCDSIVVAEQDIYSYYYSNRLKDFL